MLLLKVAGLIALILAVNARTISMEIRESVSRPPEAFPFPPPYFDCLERAEGFYADLYRRCKVFYYCKADGTRLTHSCPGDYIFDEILRSCGPPDQVICASYEP